MLKRNYDFYNLLKLYKVYAGARGFSLKTIRTTESNLKMIGKVIPLETRLKRFNEKSYENFLLNLRESRYSLETIYDLNATLRKLLALAERKKLIRNNPARMVENFSIQSFREVQLISRGDFRKIREYFSERGEREFEFLFILLYYTGIRIGEALALTPDDFREGKVLINKSYLYEFRMIKEPKNKKFRSIPTTVGIRKMLRSLKIAGGARIFMFSPNAANEALKRVARTKKIPEFHCHSFRHTYISNLIRAGVPLPVISSVSGDTQKTILKRYSHVFPGDEKLVLKALRATEPAAKPEGYRS